MKKKSLLFSALIMLFAFISCSDESVINLNESQKSLQGSDLELCGDAKIVDLIAGQHINVGTVTISNDKNNLYVTYETNGDWRLTETHLYVGPDEDIPLNKPGNPIFGHFPYKKNHNNLENYTYVVSLSLLDECFSVVTHASVDKIVNGEVVQGETAFGCGDKEFPGKRWGCYTDYCKQECEEVNCIEIFGKKYKRNTFSCLNSGDQDRVNSVWSNKLAYVLWFDSNRHDLDLFANDVSCDVTGLSQIGQIQIINNENSDTKLNVSFIISDANYNMTSLSLYMGTEENPYEENGDLKPTVSPSDFYTKEFDSPVSVHDFSIEWLGDQDLRLTNEIHIIASIKVCE